MTYIELTREPESPRFRVLQPSHSGLYDWAQALAAWTDAFATAGLWTNAEGQLRLTSRVKSLVCTLIGPGDIRVTLALTRQRHGRRSPLHVQSTGHGVTLSYRVGPDIEDALEAWTRAGVLSDLLSPTGMPTEHLRDVICRAWVTAPNETMPRTERKKEASPREIPNRQPFH